MSSRRQGSPQLKYFDCERVGNYLEIRKAKMTEKDSKLYSLKYFHILQELLVICDRYEISEQDHELHALAIKTKEQ